MASSRLIRRASDCQFGSTYSSTFTILWQSASTHSNGAGGFCAPATGSVTLTLTGLGTRTKQEAGEVCEVGATGANVAHTFTGTFTVQSGTGILTGSTGNGTGTFTSCRVRRLR